MNTFTFDATNNAHHAPAPTRHHTVTIALHWVLALGLIGQLALGLWMQEIPKTPPGVRAEWFNLHKSVGLSLAALIALRMAWRLTHTPPSLPMHLPQWQSKAARINHGLLYLSMFLMPVSGFLGSSFTPYPIKFFGTPLPRLWEASATMKTLFSEVHEMSTWCFMAVLALHVLAAVWHAARRDAVMSRMWPGGGTPTHT